MILQLVCTTFIWLFYDLFGLKRLPHEKSWTLAGGTLQHLVASLYIKLYDYGNIVLCCEILLIQISHSIKVSKTKSILRDPCSLRTVDKNMFLLFLLHLQQLLLIGLTRTSVRAHRVYVLFWSEQSAPRNGWFIR